MSSTKFIHIAIQMLVADYMEDALIATLEHGPETFNSICVSHINDIFTDTMVHYLMVHISHSLVAQCLICVDCGSWIDVIPDKPFQGSRWRTVVQASPEDGKG